MGLKLVQPLETGKVRKVFVANGSKVREGQEVVALDDSEAHAEELSLAASLASYKAEVARRTAAINAARLQDFQVSNVSWPKELPENVLNRERKVLAGDLGLLSASLASLKAQSQQKEAERQRLKNTIASQEEQLKIDENRAQLRKELEVQRLGTKVTLYDAMETLQSQRTSLAQQQGQLAEAT